MHITQEKGDYYCHAHALGVGTQLWHGLLHQCQTRRSSFSSYTALHPAGGTQVSNCSSNAMNVIIRSPEFLTRNPPLHLGVNPHLSPVSTGYQLPGVWTGCFQLEHPGQHFQLEVQPCLVFGSRMISEIDHHFCHSHEMHIYVSQGHANRR